jgi:hypothetical protein
MPPVAPVTSAKRPWTSRCPLLLLAVAASTGILPRLHRSRPAAPRVPDGRQHRPSSEEERMSGLLGASPDDLEVQARRLAAAAAAVHRQVRRVEAAGRATRWQGIAADAFRAALREDVARLQAAADRLEDAAAALLSHAAMVRERLAALAAAREAVRDAAAGFADGARGAASDAVDAVLSLGQP